MRHYCYLHTTRYRLSSKIMWLVQFVVNTTSAPMCPAHCSISLLSKQQLLQCAQLIVQSVCCQYNFCSNVPSSLFNQFVVKTTSAPMCSAHCSITLLSIQLLLQCAQLIVQSVCCQNNFCSNVLSSLFNQFVVNTTSAPMCSAHCSISLLSIQLLL